MTTDIYQHKGYDNRADYLASLAEDYGISILAVISLAQLLGPEEDFDGLVSSIQDLPEQI